MRLRLAALLAPALLAAALILNPGTASAAPADTDPTPSPAGANNWSCHPSAAHPRPVVLVHGTFANRYNNWLALSPLLKSKGYCVFALTYGATGVNTDQGGLLLPIGGLAPVASSAAQLATFVDQVRAATGSAKVDLVGHSQGGMMPQYYLKFLGGAAKVNALIGLAPDNHGTTLDGIANLAPYFPGVADLVFTACPSCRDQVAGSAFMRHLTANGDTVPGVKYTVIATRYDEVVTPYRTQFLSSGDNLLVQDNCFLDLAEHVTIAFDPTALHHVTNALDPAHATPVYCG